MYLLMFTKSTHKCNGYTKILIDEHIQQSMLSFMNKYLYWWYTVLRQLEFTL